MNEILLEERDLEPDLSSSFEVNTYSAAEMHRIDEEIELATHIFVLSSYQERTFVSAGVSPSKIIVTPLGVDTDMFSPRLHVEPGRSFTIVFAGQITQRKGISYLLRAVEALEGNTRLLMVGRPVGDVSTILSHPLVEHIPHVTRSDLPAIYARSDVFVLPSLVEGFGLTGLEAMASGLPVIVSDHTFGSDVVREAEDGFVVPIRSVSALVESLTLLQRNPELRQRMGASARERALCFTWEAYGASVADEVGAAIAALGTR